MKSKLFRVLGVVAVVAMLATSLVAPVNALANVALADSVKTISTASNPIVSFTVSAPITAGAAGITITFDTGWVIGTPVVAIATTPGIGSGVIGATFAPAQTSVSGQAVILDTSVVGLIGTGAIVQLTFTSGITNPSTVGSYGVTVKTQSETTAVATNTITTVTPTPAALPGIASIYNTAGILMYQENNFTTALSDAAIVGNGAVIKLTAGTYNTAFGTLGTTVSILGQGTTAGDVILKSTAGWSLTGPTVTVNMVTIDGSTGALSLAATVAGTVSNSNIKKNGLLLTTAFDTVDTCVFTVATGETGVTISGASTVKNSTFNVTGTGLCISSTAALTATNDTFAGTATASVGNGLGINQSGAVSSTIGTSKFTALTNALTIGSGTVAFNGNTVDSCGNATAPALLGDTIVVNGATAVSILNNTITNSVVNILKVTANDNLINMMMNTFKGNAKNVDNTTAPTVALNATHNFWSGAATPADVAGKVTYANALAVAPTSANFTVTTVVQGTFDASATAGVFVTATTAAPIGSVIGASALPSNPVAAALPTTVTLKRYFDVFAFTPPAAAIGTADIRFYAAAAGGISSTDVVYMYNAATGSWVAAASVANPFGNYVTVAGVAGSGLNGTPFALVSVNPTGPTTVGGATAPVFPALGATNVGLNPTFTWPSVTGAVSYDFVLAEDLGTVNKFDIIDYSNTTPAAATVAKETLKANTTYWWRVRATGSNGLASDWTQYFFTTGAGATTSAPGTTTTTTIVVSQPPAVTTVVTTNPITITNTQTTTEAIPTYLLWAVILVGAVLVISVIVLIVRTRKI